VGMGAENPRWPRRIHQDKDGEFRKKYTAIPGTGSKYFFYKSHILDNPRLNPTDILYLYRHPLDVLLSALNFQAIRAEEGALSQEHLSRTFKGGIAKNCEQINADGQMGFYISRFSRDMGESLFPQYVKYSTHVMNALDNPKVIAMRYEDLIDDTLTTSKKSLSKLFGVDAGDIAINLDAVNKATIGSGHPFYWKAKAGTRFEFFSARQIAKFERKHRKLLSRLGYYNK